MKELSEAQRMTGWAEAGETLVGWFLSVRMTGSAEVGTRRLVGWGLFYQGGVGVPIAGTIEQYRVQGDEIELHVSGFRRNSLFCMVLPLAALRAAEVTPVGWEAWHRGRKVQFWVPDPAYQPRPTSPWKTRDVHPKSLH